MYLDQICTLSQSILGLRYSTDKDIFNVKLSGCIPGEPQNTEVRVGDIYKFSASINLNKKGIEIGGSKKTVTDD